jgi:hypothetical protein
MASRWRMLSSRWSMIAASTKCKCCWAPLFPDAAIEQADAELRVSMNSNIVFKSVVVSGEQRLAFQLLELVT